MYACHCRGVSDRTVRAAVSAGGRCIEDVQRMCGAGTGCGGCWPLLHELIGTQEPTSQAAHSAA